MWEAMSSQSFRAWCPCPSCHSGQAHTVPPLYRRSPYLCQALCSVLAVSELTEPSSQAGAAAVTPV